MNKKEYFIKVSDILGYCKEAAKLNRMLAEKCIASTGLGESETSSLGGAAYFLEQARIHEYDIPRIIQDIKGDYMEPALDDTPLEALGLSTRSYNCLKRANIDTLGDIINMYEYELRQIRNLGNKAADEIIRMVKRYGVSMKGAPNDGNIQQQER